ncbi:hypothetical protein R1sor_019843 [Riccia sorocarpa]|uniref:Uncharacterized protein n=1 Tax=Riccia sorocarpa TaxID=122646 RepID=A0ABD3IES5_9MARC
MAPFKLQRVNYRNYVSPWVHTFPTVMVPGRVILPEEWEVWDAVIPVTWPWPAVRNPNNTPCYARRGTGVSHTQSEGTLLQDPRVAPSNVQDSPDCEDGDIEETPAVRRLLEHLVRVSGRPRKQADVSIKGTAWIGTCTEETPIMITTAEVTEDLHRPGSGKAPAA